MSSSSFEVAIAFGSLATRESGAKAREGVLGALNEHSTVTLDFSDAHPTPSFADEFVGRLAGVLGEDAFRQRIRIIGVGSAERPLLHQVVLRRLQQRREARQGRPDTIFDDAT